MVKIQYMNMQLSKATILTSSKTTRTIAYESQCNGHISLRGSSSGFGLRMKDCMLNGYHQVTTEECLSKDDSSEMGERERDRETERDSKSNWIEN